MAEGPIPPVGDDPFRALADALRLVSAGGQGPESAGPLRGGPVLDYGVLARFLGEAALVYAATGLRLWGGMLGLWGRAIPPLARTFAEASAGNPARSDGYALLVDALQAHLRELAELPYQETRRLQADLERIAAMLHPPAPGGSDEGAQQFWRRWETKP